MAQRLTRQLEIRRVPVSPSTSPCLQPWVTYLAQLNPGDREVMLWSMRRLSLELVERLSRLR